MTLLTVLGRWLLGGFLALAGIAHLTFARDTFRAQVPDWLPFEDFVIVASGVVEIALGLALLVLVRHRVLVGWVVAAFFVAVLPGNINQLVTHSDAFGLDTDRARAIRLVFQPVLVAWALWCTGAWKDRAELLLDPGTPPRTPDRRLKRPQVGTTKEDC